MNTLENNKLIAEFMGGKEIRKDNFQFPNENGIYSGYPIQLEGLKYHWNWDSLMEVVKKINPLNRNDNYNYSRLMNMTLEEALNIDRVYLHVVEFIKYYNKQNN